MRPRRDVPERFARGRGARRIRKRRSPPFQEVNMRGSGTLLCKVGRKTPRATEQVRAGGCRIARYGGPADWDECLYRGGVGRDVLPEGDCCAGAAFLLRDAV